MDDLKGLKVVPRQRQAGSQVLLDHQLKEAGIQDSDIKPVHAARTETDAALAVLVGVTLLAAVAGQRRGYLVVGWLWFLGMLIPVVGLLPFGLRVMHDRYSYVPMIGLAIAISFGAADLVARFRVPRAVPIAAATVVLTLCAVLSWNQAGVWRNSLTLFDHALAVTERLGLEEMGGLLRVGLVHYNTAAEVDRFLDVVRKWV